MTSYRLNTNLQVIYLQGFSSQSSFNPSLISIIPSNGGEVKVEYQTIDYEADKHALKLYGNTKSRSLQAQEKYNFCYDRVKNKSVYYDEITNDDSFLKKGSYIPKDLYWISIKTLESITSTVGATIDQFYCVGRLKVSLIGGIGNATIFWGENNNIA